MLEVANLLGHAAKMTRFADLSSLYDMITYNAAKTMRISNHKLEVGAPANLVILHGVQSIYEAIRKTPPARTTIRRGKVISKTQIQEELSYNTKL